MTSRSDCPMAITGWRLSGLLTALLEVVLVSSGGVALEWSGGGVWSTRQSHKHANHSEKWTSGIHAIFYVKSEIKNSLQLIFFYKIKNKITDEII